ncbi:MAG: phosphoribosylglycinamide formyltransferase, partial [Betaproteobacteria bacterium]|nr:phosphoribosylglycinamide formyltransferase [Betaproteobacteria bacterium]
LPLRIVCVISNRAGAAGLVYAAGKGIATRVLEQGAFASREDFDRALAALIGEYAPDLVALAGFMRILGERFVHRYEGRLVNIHPSLLPAFPGLHTHRRALDAGVKIHGCTVHFVTAQLDNGPIIVQAAVPVLPGDDEDRLAERVLRQEHRIYPLALRWFAEGRLVIERGVVRVRGEEASQSLLAAQ